MDTRKALALLAYLAVNGGSHARDRLATLLWPNYDEARARGAFRRTLSTLNKALGSEGLEISREAIALSPKAGLWADVLEFRRRLSAVAAHAHNQNVCPTCLPLLHEAAALYQGDFLSGFTLRDSANFEEWQFLQAEALRQELAGALEKLVQGLTAQAGYLAAIPLARRWLALDTLREEAHRELMRLYEWSGQHGAALRQYRECVRVLEQEIAVPPLEETTRLYEAIQAHRLPPPAPPARAAEISPPKLLVSSRPHGPAREKYPLVGRTDELQALGQAHQACRSDGQLVALQGEAGIGKTRLAAEFLALAQANGAAVVSARCYEGEENLAYAPVIQALRISLSSAAAQPEAATRLQRIQPVWLAEVARLMPDLAPALRPHVAPGVSSAEATLADAPDARSRFMESLSQVLVGLCAGDAPGVLFFDDLHWADHATLDLLAYLVRRLLGRPLLILAAWRDELTPATPALQRLMAEARRARLGREISLQRLEPAAVSELVHLALTGSGQPATELADRIYREAEGLPFFVTRYLEALQSPAGQAGPEAALRESARDLLRSRLERAGETGAQLLSSAAVIGRSFSYNLLRAASGRSEAEIVEGLERLVELRLIQEQPSAEPAVSYDFTHDQLRSLVYDRTSLARRRLLHRRTAEAYAALVRLQCEAGALAAYHYQQAGLPAQAAEYYKLAGDAAQGLYANRDAMAHYQSALTCGYGQPAGLHEAIGDLQALLAEYPAALASYETAAALCAPGRLPRVEHRLGLVYHQLGDWDLAECHFEAAANGIDQDRAPAEKARVLADWSRTAYRRAQLNHAQELATSALALAEASDDRLALAQVRNMLGVLARGQNRPAEAIAYLQRSLELATELGDMGGQAAALNNLARAYAESGEAGKAIELTQQALELCSRRGDRHRVAALHNNLADLYHATGDASAVMEHLKQAVAVFAEIDKEAGGPKPEIWMLAEW